MKEYVGRGVVTTSTYEARWLGVYSAMGIMKAARLAPEAILLPTDFDAYRRYSKLFKQAVTNIVPDIEDRSIDEIYIDLSGQRGEMGSLALRLKQAVFAATGLSCSIDRKSVVEGKRVSVRLDSGGCRIVKKKKKKI